KPPSEISRKDEVWIGPRGVVTIAGGKLTGYRPMAAGVVDTAVARLGLRAAPAPADETDPLPGGDMDGEVGDLAAELQADHGLDEAVAGRLARLYGTEAELVLARGSGEVTPGSRVVTGEVET